DGTPYPDDGTTIYITDPNIEQTVKEHVRGMQAKNVCPSNSTNTAAGTVTVHNVTVNAGLEEIGTVPVSVEGIEAGRIA
ncbi:hypothetical protein HK102_006773, partial [Quaeritorhiza haematococci]